MKINEKEFGTGKNCFIIAEAGVNHNGSLHLAKQLVDAAKDAGVDAVKFQTFKTDELVTEDANQASYQTKNTGKKESQSDMLKRLELSDGDFKEIKNYCDEKGIVFMSTPHTFSAVDMLDSLMPAYKIGSGDLNNLPLLEYIAKKEKPVILSTGMGSMDEILESANLIQSINKNLILLHCTTSYPCPFNDVNLAAMDTIKEKTGCVVGYSDHTEGIDVSLMAVSLGAYVIEKHFTLDKNLPGPDHKASLDPQELKELVKRIREEDLPEVTSEVLGSAIKSPTNAENEIAKIARKSIVAKRDIDKGSEISKEDLIIKRPGTGILPKKITSIVGKKAKNHIKKDAVLEWSDIE